MNDYLDAWQDEAPWPRLDELARLFREDDKAPQEWFKAVLEHPFFGELQVWKYVNATDHAFHERLGDLKPGIIALIEDEDETRAQLGAELALQCGFAVELGERLIALLKREDDAANVVRNGMKDVKDPKLIALLIDETKHPGDRGWFAISALGNTDSPAGQPVLRRIALDKAQDRNRRRQAMHGLSPFGDAEDRKAADALLVEGDEELALAAVFSYLDSRQTTDPPLLRTARAVLKPRMQGYADELLALSGDDEALALVIGYARSGSEGRSREEWYHVLARCPDPAAATAMVEELAKEEDSGTRWRFLESLGERGDTAAVDALAARRTHKEDGEFATGILCRLACDKASATDAVLDRIVAEKATAVVTLRDFGREWSHTQMTDENLSRLQDACIRLFERGLKVPSTRRAAAAALKEMTGHDLGSDEEDLARWKEWRSAEVKRRSRD